MRTSGWGRTLGVGALWQGMRSAEGVRMRRRKRRDKIFFNKHAGSRAGVKRHSAIVRSVGRLTHSIFVILFFEGNFRYFVG